jgi:hypothetical protein
MPAPSIHREFTLAEITAIGVMLNERRTLQARGQNLPGRELYLQRFGSRFRWRPSIARIAALEWKMQRDSMYCYQGAGSTWSTETRAGSNFTQQESGLFAREFLALGQQQRTMNAFGQQELMAEQAQQTVVQQTMPPHALSHTTAGHQPIDQTRTGRGVEQEETTEQNTLGEQSLPMGPGDF